MNKRIKELIKQAADQTSAAFSSSNFRQSEWESDFREKFAELIVQDCVNIINHRADTSADYLDSKKANDHARQVQRDCATTLEYAFGLKEMEMAE